MLLVELNLIGLSSHYNLLFLLILVELHLLEDVYCVFLLLGLNEHPAGDDAVEQVLEVFLGLAGPGEEVFLELVVVLVGVLLVNLHGGEGELAAVDEGALKLLVAEVVEGQSALLHPLLHQRLQTDHVPQEAVLTHARVGLKHRGNGYFFLGVFRRLGHLIVKNIKSFRVKPRCVMFQISLDASLSLICLVI